LKLACGQTLAVSTKPTVGCQRFAPSAMFMTDPASISAFCPEPGLAFASANIKPWIWKRSVPSYTSLYNRRTGPGEGPICPFPLFLTGHQRRANRVTGARSGIIEATELAKGKNQQVVIKPDERNVLIAIAQSIDTVIVTLDWSSS
jgi:hypothetical protein